MAYYVRPKVYTQVYHPFYPAKRIYYSTRVRAVQKPITSAPLPYEYQGAKITTDPAKHMGDAANHTAITMTVKAANWASNRALDRAYSKFKDAVHSSTAQTAANWAERRQTVDMIADDCATLRKAWQALRKGELHRFKRILRIRDRQNRYWSKPTDAAKLWLQYHFGWEPLVKDIYSSIEILQSEGPSGLAVGRATVNAPGNWGVLKSGWYHECPVARYRYLLQARVKISNPNLMRASQLGLVNPAAVAWEVIPFSFLVDWFIPIGDFLNQWSDFLGLTFVDAFTTQSRIANVDDRYYNASGALVQYNGFCKSWSMYRTLGISKPWPYPKAFKGFSVTRGATAIALLVAVLKPGLQLPQPVRRGNYLR